MTRDAPYGKLPPELEKLVSAVGADSLARGRSVRRTHLLQEGLALTVVIGIFAASGMSDALFIAITIAVASLCIVWALMSMSASLNAQLDTLVAVIKFYAEREQKL